jgi:hypothetical protein
MPGRTSKQESLPPAWWATPGSTATWHGAMPSTTAGFRGRDFRHRLARSSTLGGQAVYLQNAVSKEILEQEFSPVSSPDEARRAVREKLRQWRRPHQSCCGCWSRSHLAVSLPLAGRRQGCGRGCAPACLKVATHATSKVAIQTAIDAGVDSVEHGEEATDQQLRHMKDKGIFLVATDLWSNGASM